MQNVALTIDGSKLATPSQGVVKLWDTTTGKFLSSWSGTTERFIRIGHSLAALVAAWIGGQLSRHLQRGSSRPAASTLSDTEA
jgi:hypothetical protein